MSVLNIGPHYKNDHLERTFLGVCLIELFWLYIWQYSSF